jgi:hypothetical protein
MAEPVLVVHGVANRDRDQFEAQVISLNQRVGANFDFIPVYWGDLGAGVAGIADTLPTIPGFVPDLLDDLQRGSAGAMAMRAIPSDSKTIVTASAQSAFIPTAGGVRSLARTQSADVAQAIAEVWDSTKSLKMIDDPATLHRIGAAIGGAAAQYSEGPPASSYQVGGATTVEEFTKSIINAIDDALGAALGNVAGVFIQYLRGQLDPGIAHFLGDALVYQRHRDLIQQRIAAALANLPAGSGRGNNNPISVIGHSLGGVALFDYAVNDSNPLWIKSLVTFGSQSAFFHIIDPRSSKVAVYAGRPVSLPATIQRWTNLWEPMDPLAFIAAKIFVLASSQPPSDLEVDHTFDAGLWTHSAYWTNAQVEGQIRAALT